MIVLDQSIRLREYKLDFSSPVVVLCMQKKTHMEVCRQSKKAKVPEPFGEKESCHGCVLFSTVCGYTVLSQFLACTTLLSLAEALTGRFWPIFTAWGVFRMICVPSSRIGGES